jgi:hypothetical protein
MLPKLRRFWRFLIAEPFILPILEELKANQPGKAAAEWANACPVIPMGLPDVDSMRKAVAQLPTEKDHVGFVYHFLDGVTNWKWDFARINEHVWGGGLRNTQAFESFKSEAIGSLCDYLDEQLDGQQSLVGLLVRYKKRCEWFSRSELMKIAEEERAKKHDEGARAEVEDSLKKDLYRYLHDQGFEFTIEPYSHKGRIDLILDQPEGSRQYLEGKVFDNQHRNAAYVVKGFGQLLHYLRQFNAPDGYLLVYKTCKEHLVIDRAEILGQIPFVRCEGKTIFVLVVDLCEYQEPVSRRQQDRIAISAELLCRADRAL